MRCTPQRTRTRCLATPEYGQSAIFFTKGNPDCHVILRGGQHIRNYDAASIAQACALIEKADLAQRVMVDCSHANTTKTTPGKPWSATISPHRLPAASGESSVR